ncbi:MAG: hypothetical protein KatS3mg090_0092 [Patescibacteria group bacterium]|nr:MAG: hypothetical protein KatS3mg090_0092 [Patescibacteria group bacterium]
MKVYALDLSKPEVNPIAQFSDINTIFSLFFRLALGVGFIMFITAGLYGTYLLISSSGNPDQVGKAKTLFTFSVIGFILVTLSLVISRVLAYIFKIPVYF